MNMLFVALGGFLGSILRFYIYNKTGKSILGTWIANISGSLLFAIVYKIYSDSTFSEHLWIFLTVGFCGSYTTFSTFGNETLQFILQRKYFQAFMYILSSFFIAFLSVLIIFNVF